MMATPPTIHSTMRSQSDRMGFTVCVR
jgi:hypothetical protein